MLSIKPPRKPTLISLVSICLLMTVAAWAATAAEPPADDWPTVHHDVARSAYTSDSPAPPFHQKWVFTGAVLENIDTWAEAIIAGDKVFVGTFAGNLYCLNRADGAVKWKYAAGNLIVGAPAVYQGVVYVGSLGDLGRAGFIHAVDVETGQARWKVQADGGFWSSPCCEGGLVMMGARNGIFYAIDAASGKEKWRFSAPRPILGTAAVAGENVLFAAEDGRGYCLNRADGKLAWKSDSLLSVTMRGYYPIIWGDSAIFVTMPACKTYNQPLRDQGEDLLGRSMGGEIVGVRSEKWKKKAVAGVPADADVEKERQVILDWLKQDPTRQAAYALKLADGKPKFMMPIIYHAGSEGQQNAGCVTPDGWFATAAASYFNNWRADQAYGAVRINAADGKLAILNWAKKDPKAPFGFGNTFEYDEAYNFAAGGKRIYFTHQDNTWGIDLDGNVGFAIAGARDEYGGIYGGLGADAGRGKYIEVDGVKVYSSPNQWHGTGQGCVAVSGKELFWITGGMVICLEGGGAGKPVVMGTQDTPSTRPAAAIPQAKEAQPADIDALVDEAMPASATIPAEAAPIAAALNQHVEEMLAAGELMPLICPTGSFTVYAFNHTRDEFQRLSMALPYLKPELRQKVVDHLKGQFDKTPPFQPQYLTMTGKARNIGGTYDIVKAGSATSTRSLRSYEGMYALWAFCHYGQQKALAEKAWPQIEMAWKQAAGDAAKLIQKSPAKTFDRNNGSPAIDTNELVNALVAISRLARMTSHDTEAAQAREALLPLVRERLKFPIRSASSYASFGADPVLWYSLTPELARLLGRLEAEKIKAATDTPGLHKGNLFSTVDFTRKNFWHLTWGEGMHTAEQAIIYPQYPIALFNLRAFVFEDKPTELAHLADLPWCTGDLYYIEKLSETLWAYAGRPWEK